MSSTVFVEIRMLKDAPAIIGTDMNTYGPFVKDRVYAIPKENARSFLKLGLAVATRKEAEKPTLKEMFKGEVLNGYVERARVIKPLDSNPEFHWVDWGTWKSLLWDKWVKTAGTDKINMKSIELHNLYQWFVRACDLAGLDPDEVDVSSYVHYWMNYNDAKQALDEFLKTPPSEAEYKAMYEEYKHGLQEDVRAKFPEAFADLDKRIAKLERETASLPRLEREKERYKRMSEELQYQLEETKRRVEEERKALEKEVAPIKIRVLKSFGEGIMDYVVGQVVETRNLDWALDKVEKGYVERVAVEVPVTPPPPPPKELSEAEKKKLADLFETGLRRRLGRVPHNAMAEFRVEFETIKTLSYPKAVEMIELLVRDIVVREEKLVVPRVPVAVPPPEVVIPPEIAIIPPLKPIPKTPISPLPFPRAPSSEEKMIIWEHFKYDLASAGIDYSRWVRAYQERIGLPFKTWDAFLKTYKEFIDSIITGKPVVFIPIPTRVAMPWREDTEEHWRYDAICHLASTGTYETIDDLIYSHLPVGLENYGVSGVTPEEIKETIKKAWKEKTHWFVAVPKQRLEKLIEQTLE